MPLIPLAWYRPTDPRFWLGREPLVLDQQRVVGERAGLKGCDRGHHGNESGGKREQHGPLRLGPLFAGLLRALQRLIEFFLQFSGF